MNQRNTQFNTSIKLIQKASAEKWIRTLALYHLHKATYSNSVVFDYRNRMREFADQFDISTKTLYRHFDVMRSKGLIIDFAGNRSNLHLASIHKLKRQLKDRCKSTIMIEENDGLFDVSCLLYGKLIERHIKHMSFCRAIQGFGRHSREIMQPYEGAPTPLFSFSIRNMAKLLNLNERTVRKVLRKLEELHILRLHPSRVKKLTSDILDFKLIKDYPGYLFVTNSGTFIQFGTRIELLHFPVAIPNLSLKKYLKYSRTKQCNKYHNYIMHSPPDGGDYGGEIK